MDLENHLLRQMAFSRATFGPGRRTKGVIEHIRKELFEVEASEGHPGEWVDLVILALDGLTRSLSYVDERVREDPELAAIRACRLILDKQAKNEDRDWPDWRKSSRDKPIEHVRTKAEKKAKKAEKVG